MPRLSPRNTTTQPTRGERVFADDSGKLWSAVHYGEAIVFTCISDGRRSGRAIGVELATLGDSIGDETLRGWLNAAPLIGTLP